MSVAVRVSGWSDAGSAIVFVQYVIGSQSRQQVQGGFIWVEWVSVSAAVRVSGWSDAGSAIVSVH